jgi:hypothetical protein
MRSFDNLLKRYAIVTEAKVSPFASTHPSFGGVTKQMSARGMSSAPYDTVKFIATFLNNLDIIDSAELNSVIKAAGFKGKQIALLDVIKAKSEDIVAKSQEIADAMPEALEDYINRATINRGRDTMANVEGGSGGRTDKYAKQAAERAEKKKVAAQNKMQKQALKAASRSEDSDVQNAVDVLVNTLDTSDKILMGQEGRGIVSAGLGLKGAEDVDLDFDDIDISIGDIGEVRDTLIDKLVKFFNKQGKYTAEKTRRGLNVEGPVGSFGTDVEDVQDMITSLVMRAYPNIDGDQIVVDLNASSAAEDEEYDPEKADIDNDGETEDWEEGLAKKRGFIPEDEEGGVDDDSWRDIEDNYDFSGEDWYSNPNNFDEDEYRKRLREIEGGCDCEEGECDCEDEECDYEDDSMVTEARGYKSLTPAALIAELQSVIDLPDDKLNDVTRISMRVSREEIYERFPEIYKLLEKMYDAVMQPDGAQETKMIAQKAIDIVRSKYPNPDKYQRMRPISSYNNTMVSESYTSVYLTEMTRKSYGKTPAPQTVTFKERMKPKTIWQLTELRNYGL